MNQLRLWISISCFLWAEAAWAWGPLAGFPPIRTIDYATGMPYWRGAVGEDGEASGAKSPISGEARPAPATTAVNCKLAEASAEMVRHYPQAEQKQAATVFKQLASGYVEVMRKLQLPPNDVATAVGAFLVGNVAAYRNLDFPDESVPPLVQHLRTVLANDPQFRSATAEMKAMVCGQLALIGMFMATTRMAAKEQAPPEALAGMRQAAKSYLEAFLKTDAARVEISARGLVLR